jgi:hypothetical protein
LFPVAHEDADHLVALFEEQMGRDAGIDSATHGQHNARHTASLGLRSATGKDGLAATAAPAYNSRMEKEYVDRAKAIREGILQLRDSL